MHDNAGLVLALIVVIGGLAGLYLIVEDVLARVSLHKDDDE